MMINTPRCDAANANTRVIMLFFFFLFFSSFLFFFFFFLDRCGSNANRASSPVRFIVYRTRLARRDGNRIFVLSRGICVSSESSILRVSKVENSKSNFGIAVSPLPSSCKFILAEAYREVNLVSPVAQRIFNTRSRPGAPYLFASAFVRLSGRSIFQRKTLIRPTKGTLACN